MFPVRSVVVGAFIPVFAFEMGVGAVLPVLPVAGRDLGASLATAGLLAALLPVGKILANLPAGWLATRWGDRGAMLVASGVGVLAFVGAALAPAVPVLALTVLLMGAGSSVFALARHSYLTQITPVAQRSRVLSTLGGVHRIGVFVGPFVGAAVVHLVDVRAAFWLAACCAASALVVLLAGREPGRRRGGGDEDASRSTGPGVRRVFADHRSLFATLGVAVVLVGATRGARLAVLPLWMEHLGFDPAVISVVFGTSAAVDVLLFYPAGRVMDRWGRLWVAIPAMVVMAGSLAALPLAETLVPLCVVAAGLGLGNGMSSGILMTLGADVAPPEGRASFLSVWRLFQDCGDATGPLLLSLGAGLGSLATGIWVVALLAASGGLALRRWVPRWSVHASRGTRRLAGLDPVLGSPLEDQTHEEPGLTR